MKDETRRHFDVLARLLNGYWHVEDGGPHEASQMRTDLSTSIRPDIAERFKRQLASAITDGTVKLEDLKKWTSLALDSEEEVAEELKLVWRLVYGNDDPLDFRA